MRNYIFQKLHILSKSNLLYHIFYQRDDLKNVNANFGYVSLCPHENYICEAVSEGCSPEFFLTRRNKRFYF